MSTAKTRSHRWFMNTVCQGFVPLALAAPSLFGAGTAQAQTSTPATWDKPATDLKSVIHASSTPQLGWARDQSGALSADGGSSSTADANR